MTDYINALVPVSNGDANNNYPWMQIRAGGSQTTASRFGEIKMSNGGQISGKFSASYVIGQNATALNVNNAIHTNFA